MKDVSYVHHMEVIENVAVKMFFLIFCSKGMLHEALAWLFAFLFLCMFRRSTDGQIL